MGSQILKNVRTWVDGFDLTGQSNSGALDLMYEVHDVTVFRPVGQGGARERACGLEDIAASQRGLWAAGANSVDADAFSNLGRTDVVMTMSPDGLEGSVCYMMRTGRFKYSLFGEHGKPAPFSLDFKGAQGETAVARGMVAKTDSAAVAATGPAGSVVELGAVGASQYLYAALHVLSAGTTITVQVQSDDSAGMGSPTTRMTLGPVTAVGGVWGVRVAGPITDTHWRLNVSAITGSFLLAGLIGIR